MECKILCTESEYIGKEFEWLYTVATDRVYAVAAEEVTGIVSLLPIDKVIVRSHPTKEPEKLKMSEPGLKLMEGTGWCVMFSDEKDLHIITGDNLKEQSYDLLKLACDWFRTTNDAFYVKYGFNFNPHEYSGLYEKAKEVVDAENRLHMKVPRMP